jgi:quaternary ammonium compound-resistance protein SugE
VSWILLVVAGLLEVVWASVLPSVGWSRPLPTAVFVVALAGSMVLLARAVDPLPLGTAYAVWVGIGAVGATIVGIAAHGDPATPARIGFMVLLLASIVGLKVTGA